MAICGLVCRRRVTSMLGGQLTGHRELTRRLSMGLPISLLRWSLTYDPIIHALQQTTCATTPTYLDDLSAL
eukprot:9004970-Prorocentrum_lima.AAC.1